MPDHHHHTMPSLGYPLTFSAGRYQLLLQLKTGGEVGTDAYTLEATP
jgi:hypothetical protein